MKIMKRLKIVEQLVIVLVFAALLPLAIAALIVTNVNQHAVRSELQYSAIITADNIYQRLSKSFEEKKKTLSYIAESLNFISSQSQKELYLQQILDNSDEINNLDIAYVSSETDKDFFYTVDNDNLIIYQKISNNKFLREFISLNDFKKDVFKFVVDSKRQIFIVDSNYKALISNNNKVFTLTNELKRFFKAVKEDKPVIFGEKKNEPKILLKLSEPNWSIIVLTPENATKYSIINSRHKILLAISLAALSIILVVSTYGYYLYINIRQLFKAISAISKGYYGRRIRLINNIFTPYEIIFLANEFNKMIKKIDKAYTQIKKKNKKLEAMDKYKSNLVDTVSHEFRTPLTSIKGYTSRLLRTDIQIDDAIKLKSLKIIKQQAERLGRMVEDMLVIPDIESSSLRVFLENISLNEIINDCILFLQHNQNRKFNLTVEGIIPNISADKGRVEQIVINLLDNAIKYSPENSQIDIFIKANASDVIVSIKNESPHIDDEKLNSLFDKFTRVDDDLTRTTRGTGLGLFIVKGLVETMNGTISLSSFESNFQVEFSFPLAGE